MKHSLIDHKYISKYISIKKKKAKSQPVMKFRINWKFFSQSSIINLSEDVNFDQTYLLTWAWGHTKLTIIILREHWIVISDLF